MDRESNAIIAYLIDKYDADHKASVDDENEKYLQVQWLFFQSGQGCVLQVHIFSLLNRTDEAQKALLRPSGLVPFLPPGADA